MITVTPEAAAQVRQSAEAGNAQNMSLRIAARREQDGTFVYGMGFDDAGTDDTSFVSEGISLLVANSMKDLLDGATLDFVEIGPGDRRFIFINPNDPAHASTPPSGEPA